MLSLIREQALCVVYVVNRAYLDSMANGELIADTPNIIVTFEQLGLSVPHLSG